MELTYHTDVHTQHVHMLPRTAYHLPYTSLAEYQAHPSRHEMERVTMLNGTWAFQYFESLQQFQQRATQSSRASMHVPGVWNLQGYDQIQYCNVQFPIPFDPPNVPKENACGYYEKSFTIHNYQTTLDYHLTFEGVSGAHYIWMNGVFVGYAQISHARTQFDITDVVTPGENHLAVLVLKYSDATYFEDQDMFRHSGIFRDVYIVGRSRVRLDDYQIHTGLDGEDGFIDVNVQSVTGTLKSTYQLFTPEDQCIDEGVLDVGKTRLTVSAPHLWSAENPALYTLVITAGDECLVQRVGIRDLKIAQQQLWVNGQSVKLRGVNYHDSDPQTGYTVSEARLIEDLNLMKKANFNAIRTAHYPKSPRFYELTDAYGFYVMSEADLETHGVVMLYGEENVADFNILMDDPRYEQAVVDRVDASIVPFKNFSSIISWSMGNESGYGCNMEAALRHAKNLDASRPLHYEGAHYAEAYHSLEQVDMISRMYPSPEEIESRYLARKDLDKPFVLCEYAHAMGNSPGGLTAYHDLLDKYDSFIGAFVWEWCDHAVQTGMHHGRPVYRYGGDFGEEIHDGHFCVDGIVSPHRRPHAGYYEFQQIHRPLVCVSHTGTRLTFENRLDFTHAKTFLELEITITMRSGDVQTVTMAAPNIAPHQRGEVDLGQVITTHVQQWSACTISYRLIGEHPLMQSGTVLGRDQIVFQRLDSAQFVPTTVSHPLRYHETAQHVQIRRHSWVYVFDKCTGSLRQVYADHQPLLKEEATLNIWRAPTDNDIQRQKAWKVAKYDAVMPRVADTDVQVHADHITVQFDLCLVAHSRPPLVEGTVKWTVYEDGTVHAAYHMRKAPRMPSLPRIGMVFALPDEFQTLTYYGNGPYESYSDKQIASFLDVFHSTVRAQYAHPIFPQEVGAHNNTTMVMLQNDALGCTAWSDTPFSFNAKPYSDAMLTEATHDDALVEEGKSYVHLDMAQSGIGTESCGPPLPEMYRLTQEQYDFDFHIKYFEKE